VTTLIPAATFAQQRHGGGLVKKWRCVARGARFGVLRIEEGKQVFPPMKLPVMIAAGD